MQCDNAATSTSLTNDAEVKQPADLDSWHPMMVSIVGPGGSGKTTAALNLIFRMCFDEIYVLTSPYCHRREDLSVYQSTLVSRGAKVTICHELYELPEPSATSAERAALPKRLYVFEDMDVSVWRSTDKERRSVAKQLSQLADDGSSLIMISQGELAGAMRKETRHRLTHQILMGVKVKEDLTGLLADFVEPQNGFTLEVLKEMARPLQEKGSFFVVDIRERDPEKRFRSAM